MKKHFFLIFLIFVCFTCFTQEQDKPFEYPITTFLGGLNTKTSPLLIHESQTPDSQNVWADEKDILSSRPGYTTYCILPDTGTFLGGWEYTKSSGEKWLIVQISSNVWASKDEGITWTKIKSGLSIINPCNSIQFMDERWFTNGFDDVWTFNGSTVTSYGFIPKGKYIETNLNQIYIANTYENPSAVYYNSTHHGPRVSQGWNALSGFYFSQNDGDVITAIKAHKGNMVVFKNNSTWGILGQEYNWEQIKYSDFYGCVSQRSIQELKQDLVFLSKRGLCRFNNGAIQQVDRAVENYTKNAQISVGSAIKKEWTQSEQSDFLEGIILENIDLYKVSGEMHTLISNEQSLNYYTNELYFTDINLRKEKSVNYNANYSPFNYSTYTYVPYYAVMVLPTTGYTIRNISLTFSRNLSTSAIISAVLYDCTKTLTANWSGQGNPSYIYNYYYSRFGNYYGLDNSMTPLIAEDITKDVDMSTKKETIFFSSGAYLGNYKNIGLTFKVFVSTYGGIANPLYDRNGLYKSFYTYSWEWNFPERTGIIGLTHLQTKYQYYFDIIPTTYAYYTSKKFNTEDNSVIWKNFVSVYTGNPTFKVKTATNSTALDATSWQTINSGDLISGATNNTWAQYRIEFNQADQRIDVVKLQWQIQTEARQDCTSATFDNRYYLSFSTKSVTNDLVIMLDNNNAFWVWDIPAGNFVFYDNKLLFTKSVYDFRLYRMFQGNSDNGTAINSYWTSKYMDLGIDSDKKINQVGITAKGSGTLFFGYKSNYDTSFTTISFILSNEPDNYVVNLSIMRSTKFWKFKVFNNTAEEYFDIIRIKIYGETVPLRAR